MLISFIVTAFKMKMIAKWMRDVAVDFEGNRERVAAEVSALCAKYPLYE